MTELNTCMGDEFTAVVIDCLANQVASVSRWIRLDERRSDALI